MRYGDGVSAKASICARVTLRCLSRSGGIMSNTDLQSFFLTAWMSLIVPTSKAVRSGSVCAIAWLACVAINIKINNNPMSRF